MKVTIDISDEMKNALFNSFGDPPEDPESSINDKEWMMCIFNHLLDHYIQKGQKRLKIPVSQLVGDTVGQRSGKATEARRNAGKK